jgi:hypothetical protein
MRAGYWLNMTVPAVGGLLLALIGAAPASALSTSAGGAAPAAPRELIYVANADSGPVTAYAVGSDGAVAPVRTVTNPDKPSTVWDPWGVTFDASGHLYVQTFISDATTFVFPRGASGSTSPKRIFKADGPDNRSIAVDAKGFEYVVGGEGEARIAVEPPGADGKPGNLYQVKPVRTIALDQSFDPWPSVLAVDNQSEILAAVARPQGNAIEIFTGGPTGSAAPVRVISGPDTGLGSCTSECDQLSIAFSPLTGQIYAAVSAGATTHISVFAGNAAGDARPVSTIEGPATGLPGQVITGITVSQLDGTIYAMVKASQFGAGVINAYGQTAGGNVPPLRSFTDRQSGFADAAGMTITN